VYRSIVAAVAILFATSAPAQGVASYPSQPVRIVVPFTAGGPADSVTRFIAQRMSDDWKQPVIVENRPGAGGSIGADAVAKSPPDGYTMVLLVTGHTILPAMQTKMPYDIRRDFSPIAIINRAPKLVVANPSVPANNMRELIALQKADPAKYSAYGTSGVGSMAHLSMELVNQLAGTKFEHVAYKGGAATVADLLGGQIPFAVVDLGSVLPHVRSGRLKVIAITSPKRSPLFPDVLTIAETLPGFEATEWFGLAGPKGMPRDVVAKIEQEIRRALSSPEAKAKYADALGWELVASTPDEMGAAINEQTQRWGELVQRVGLKVD
jgi:tripartite-type tricarboxylate transporter receptor subunit TctC